jgi:hypothetical protein
MRQKPIIQKERIVDFEFENGQTQKIHPDGFKGKFNEITTEEADF